MRELIIIAFIVIDLALLIGLFTWINAKEYDDTVVIIPARPTYEPDSAFSWEGYYVDAYCEYADEFTALFNNYDVKHARNGALLIRRGNSGPYRFAKKG